MRKSIIGLIVAVLFAASLLTGCATPYPTGAAYTGLTLPVQATPNVSSPKIGKSECKSYLGLIAIGDASIETAMKNGGIKKVHHVDWKVENILGLFGTYTVIVYGE